ncbi:uncharacterized protein LOC135366729 isoform X2 [Ornithodoros turicata]
MDSLGALWACAGRRYAEDWANMRLKLNVTAPEEKCLLQRYPVSQSYEDRLRSYRGLSTRKTTPKNLLSPWHPEDDYSPPPLSAVCDETWTTDTAGLRAMSLSSPEPDLSDYEDTSPLLATKPFIGDESYDSCSDNSSASGNGDSEDDSLFSDCSSDMSHGEGLLGNGRLSGTLDAANLDNNNFLDPLATSRTTDYSPHSFTDTFHGEFVQSAQCALTPSQFANVLSLNVGPSPTDANDLSPMSDGSSMSLSQCEIPPTDIMNDYSFRRCLLSGLDKSSKTDANLKQKQEEKILNTSSEGIRPKNMALECFLQKNNPFLQDVLEQCSLPDLLPPLKIMEDGEEKDAIDDVINRGSKEAIDLQNVSKKMSTLLELSPARKPADFATVPGNADTANLNENAVLSLLMPPASDTSELPAEPMADETSAGDVTPEVTPEEQDEDRVARIFDKAELTREATASAASLLNFTPEKVRRSGGGSRPFQARRFASPVRCGDFDVYSIESTMPTIDWVAMEKHLSRAAKEADWLARRRNDREEIRRKLAMDTDAEETYCGDRVNRKPSLTTRLQGSKNLQICFMNETAKDQEGDNGNTVPAKGPSDVSSNQCEMQQPVGLFRPENDRVSAEKAPDVPPEPTTKVGVPPAENAPAKRPSFFFNRRKSWRQHNADALHKGAPDGQKEDFATCQARLQAEARLALAQAKEMARMQMEVERQLKKKSPIADIVGIAFSDGRHRLTRQVLTDMNLAQLQVIVNDLHSQIESHNEDLVKFLMERDDLHMEQDSMLVDIEDMTRYLGAKSATQSDSSNLTLPVKTSIK